MTYLSALFLVWDSDVPVGLYLDFHSIYVVILCYVNYTFWFIISFRVVPLVFVLCNAGTRTERVMM